MNVQRLGPHQILTDTPIDLAREAVWYGLKNARVSNIVIDVNRNVVVGSTGANMSTYGQNITVSFESAPEGTMIWIKSEAQVQGTIDFGKSMRQARTMADSVEASLRQGERPLNRAVEVVPTNPFAPIASPTGEVATVIPTGPVYGVALPPKRGTAVLVYGLLGVTCCQIAGPFAWYYGSKALKEYRDADPGDKTIVRIGWILGMIGTAILLLRVGLYFAVGLSSL